MNKFKGSVLAKVFAWILITISVIGLGISVLLFAALEEEDVFSKSIMQNYDDYFNRITKAYATKALFETLENDEAVDLSKDGFRYAIVTKEDYDKAKDENYTNILYHTFDSDIPVNKLTPVELDYSKGAYLESYDALLYEGCYISYPNYGKVTRYCPGLTFYKPTGLFYYEDDGDNYYIVRNIKLELQGYKVPVEIIEEDGEEPVYIEEKKEGYIYLEYDEKQKCYVEYGTSNPLNPYDYIDYWGIMWLDQSWVYLSDYLNIVEDVSFSIENAINENLMVTISKTGTLILDYDNPPIQEYVVLASVDENQWNHEKTMSIDTLWQNFLVRSDYISDYKFADNAILKIYSIQSYIIWIGIVCFIVFLLCLVYLIAAAGHRKNHEEIVLTVWDKIPVDVFSLLICCIVCIPLAILTLVVEEHFSKYVVIYVVFAMCVALWLIVLWYVLSIATRIKNKNLFKNSIIFVIWHFFWKLLKKLVRGIVNGFKNLCAYISSFWMITIAAAFIMILDTAAISVSSAGIFLFALLLKIIMLIAVLKLFYDYRKLLKAAKCISSGDIDHIVDTAKMYHEEREMGESLNNIREGLNKAVEGRMKSERMKTELITNVSHDIKTPLTSIVNYVDLLQKEETDNENIKEYVNVLERQASRLKKLIEDLVEASKASTGNLAVNMETIDASVMISQVAGEFEEKLQQSELELIVRKPEPPVEIQADGRHLWRVIDNLINNICKYAQPNSRVYIDLEQDESEVRIILRNISKYQLNVTADELMERFVRGDESRNTEGHGLGLSIAKSLMELMNGKLEIFVDGDLFKVVLKLNKTN